MTYVAALAQETKLLFVGFRGKCRPTYRLGEPLTQMSNVAVSAGTGTENKRGIVDAVYESRALLADHKAPADEAMKSNLGM